MYAEISQRKFTEEAQVNFETLDETITVPVRAVWTDLEGKPIQVNNADLANEWSFVVKGNGEPSHCADALAIKESQIHDFSLSFGDISNIDAWEVMP
jgi:hypothetical protein